MFTIASLRSSFPSYAPRRSRSKQERKKLALEALEKRELLATGLGSAPGLTETPTARFVSGLYYDLLQRVPFRSETIEWVGAVDAAVGRDRLAAAFLNSPEYRHNLIQDDYQRFLGRTPLQTEVSSWMQQLGQGLTEKLLTTQILASAEYVQKAGGDGQSWLTSLYRDALGRTPDAPGLASWSQALARGASHVVVVRGILDSTEANTRMISQVYQDLLGRDPEAFGSSTFLAAMSRGLTVEELRSLVAGSPEYYTRQNAEGIASALGAEGDAGSTAKIRALLTEDTPLRFDFGSADSPIADQYIGVRLRTYTAERGYGWDSVSGMGWQDRRTTDPLTRDFHWGSSNTFQVDIPNGTYDVTVTLGDASQVCSGMNIGIEGQQVATNLSTAVGTFLTRTYHTQVADGRLDLRLTDNLTGQHFAINGLVLSLVPDVPPPPPPPSSLVVNAGPDVGASEGSAVPFQGTVSGGSGTLAYSWDFGDGTRSTGSLNPIHTYADNGTYTATLTVNDASGATRTDTAVVSVTNVAPNVTLARSQTGTVQTAIVFGALVSDPSPVDTAAGFSYSWSFGDGSTSTAATPSHAYATAGTYTAMLTVTDKNGGSRSATTTVTVTQAVPPGQFILTGTDRIPNFGANPTIVSLASGNWSDVRTWSLGRLPTDGDVVSIAPNTIVTYDVASAARLKTIAIQAGGRLLFRTDISTQVMVANFLVLEGGELQVGSQAQPVAANVKAQIIFLNQPLDTVADPEQYGNGLIVLGKVTMYGAVKPQTFLRLAVEPWAGATTLTLEQPAIGWRVGDRLALPDTRQLRQQDRGSQFQPQWEVLTIQSISADGLTLTLTSALQYDHRGARDADGVLEFLPHVGNLSRNVVVRSESATGVRGHTFFTSRADVDVRYVQFAGLGRTTISALDNTTFDASGNVIHLGTNQKGRYPVHFRHLVGPVTTPTNGYQFTFSGNAVTCPLNPMPFKWGITVQDSHYGLVSDNVLYNWAGAGIVTESGNESYNVFQHNFVMAIRGIGNGRSNDGLYGAGFWFHGFNNYVRDNVSASNAGASLSSGFDFTGAGGTRPIPLFKGADTSLAGQYQLVNLQLTPILEFARNEAYGAMGEGLIIWYLGTNGYQLNTMGESLIKDFRVWHVYYTGFYGYPTQHLTFDGFVVRGDPRNLNQFDGSAAWGAGDYWSGNVTIRNANIQGTYCGIAPSTNLPGTTTIENSYFRVYRSAITIATPAVPGTGGHLLPQRWDIRNVKFDPYPGAPASLFINMYYDLPDKSDPLLKVEVYVYDYQGVPGNNFQVFFKEQDASFVVPQADPIHHITGAPEAGLTNAQAWIKYGIAIAGAVAPGNATRRADIDGLILPF